METKNDEQRFTDIEMRVLYRVKKLNEAYPNLQAEYVGNLEHRHVVRMTLSLEMLHVGDDVVIGTDYLSFPMLRHCGFEMTCIRLTFDENKVIESAIVEFWCSTNPIFDVEASDERKTIMMMTDEKIRAYVEGDTDGK